MVVSVRLAGAVLNGGYDLLVLCLAKFVQLSGRLSFLFERQSLLLQLLIDQFLLIFQIAILERYELIFGVQLLGQIAGRLAVVQRLDLRSVIVMIVRVGEQMRTDVCAKQTRRLAQVPVLGDVVQFGGLFVVKARIFHKYAQTISAAHRRGTTKTDQTNRVLRRVHTILIVFIHWIRDLFGDHLLLLFLQSAQLL